MGTDVAEVYRSGRTGLSTKECGKKTWLMEKVALFMLMGMSILENG